MKKIVLLAVAAVAVLAIAAPAAAHAGARDPVRHSCNLGNDHWQTVWGSKDLGTVAYLYIVWTANPCQQAAQVKADCHSFVTGGSTSPQSGAVEGVGVKAEVTCPVDWGMLDGLKRLTGADGTPWRPWDTVCAPCAGGRKQPRHG